MKSRLYHVMDTNWWNQVQVSRIYQAFCRMFWRWNLFQHTLISMQKNNPYMQLISEDYFPWSPRKSMREICPDFRGVCRT